MKALDMVSQRSEMVEHQIKARGVRDRLVIKAMLTVPREAFLPETLQEFAYQDSPLPIAANQTISQPYIVAFMVEALALRGDEHVLEIGTGSGYAAAVLGEIVATVHTVERIDELAERASVVLKSLGYHNVHVHCGDGTLGWPKQSPFDAIVVTAGGPTVPESLLSQLKIGGRLVIPVGSEPTGQELMRITRLSQTKFKTEDIADVRFVPLIGDEGWGGTNRALAPEACTTRKLHPKGSGHLSESIADYCEPVEYIESTNQQRLLGPSRNRENP